MPDLCAVILTKNEERHIAECINSVGWADAILLSDSFSDDTTVEIATDLGAIVAQSPFVNFANQRNTALANAQTEGAKWVFFVDADERGTPALGREIRHVIQHEAQNGWWVPRFNYIMGHRMQGGGWYPDPQLRVLRVGCAHYDPDREVHETVILDGEAGTLKEHLIHYNYDSLAQFRTKQGRYLDFEAQILHKQGLKAHPWTYLSMPVREFWRRFVTLKGYRDGWVGLLLCSLMGWYMFKTYTRLAELNRKPN